jgi:hypothetical protein
MVSIAALTAIDCDVLFAAGTVTARVGLNTHGVTANDNRADSDEELGEMHF